MDTTQTPATRAELSETDHSGRLPRGPVAVSVGMTAGGATIWAGTLLAPLWWVSVLIMVGGSGWWWARRVWVGPARVAAIAALVAVISYAVAVYLAGALYPVALVVGWLLATAVTALICRWRSVPNLAEALPEVDDAEVGSVWMSDYVRSRWQRYTRNTPLAGTWIEDEQPIRRNGLDEA